MEKQRTYRFEYRGDQIRCVRETMERPPSLASKLAPWFVVALGALATYGWWMLWV